MTRFSRRDGRRRGTLAIVMALLSAVLLCASATVTATATAASEPTIITGTHTSGGTATAQSTQTPLPATQTAEALETRTPTATAIVIGTVLRPRVTLSSPTMHTPTGAASPTASAGSHVTAIPTGMPQTRTAGIIQPWMPAPVTGAPRATPWESSAAPAATQPRVLSLSSTPSGTPSTVTGTPGATRPAQSATPTVTVSVTPSTTPAPSVTATATNTPEAAKPALLGPPERIPASAADIANGASPVIAVAAIRHLGEVRRPDGVPWAGWCELFVENVASEAGMSHTRFANALSDLYAAPLFQGRAPAGSLVFFDQRSSIDGHVGVALGDGTMISALSTGIVRTPYEDWSSYIGWRPYPGLGAGIAARIGSVQQDVRRTISVALAAAPIRREAPDTSTDIPLPPGPMP